MKLLFSPPSLKRFHLTLAILLTLPIAQHAFSQSRSGLGVRYGINKPYADSYKFGSGAAFQINIAINNKWGLEPAIAYDRVNGDRETIYSPDGPYVFMEAETLDLLHLDLTARYYIFPELFVRLGPMLYVAGGNEDLSGMGIGGTAAVGYQLMLDSRNKLEFVLNTDLINVPYGGDGITPIAGLKVAYFFHFRKQ
jgi:hypothetical protein